jgi:hypothetical protein
MDVSDDQTFLNVSGQFRRFSDLKRVTKSQKLSNLQECSCKRLGTVNGFNTERSGTFWTERSIASERIVENVHVQAIVENERITLFSLKIYFHTSFSI